MWIAASDIARAKRSTFFCEKSRFIINLKKDSTNGKESGMEEKRPSEIVREINLQNQAVAEEILEIFKQKELPVRKMNQILQVVQDKIISTAKL